MKKNWTYYREAMFVILLALVSCKTSQYYKTTVVEVPFPMSINGKWFIADTLGNQIGDIKFDDLRLFKYGLAAAKLAGKYGFVNLDGDWAIKPKYENANDFYHNCALVQSNNQEIYINRKGRKMKYPNCSESSLIPGCYPGSKMKSIFNINEYKIQKEDKFAIIYEQSKDTTEFIYDSVKAFDRDFFIVERNGKFGFFFRPIQRVYKGNVYIADTIERYQYDEIVVTPPIINKYSGLYHNLAQLHKYRIGDKWGLIDWRQQCITKPKYISIKIKSQEDYYLVEYKQNEFGYIDKNGNEMFKSN